MSRVRSVEDKRDYIDAYMNHEEDIDDDSYMKINIVKNSHESSGVDNYSFGEDTSQDCGMSLSDHDESSPCEISTPISNKSHAVTSNNTSEQTNPSQTTSSLSESRSASNHASNPAVKTSANTKTTPESNNVKSSRDESGPQISVEISDNKSPANLSDVSLTSTIENAKQSFVDSLAVEVAKLEESNTVQLSNTEDYLAGTELCNSSMMFILGRFHIPTTVGSNLSMNQFINSATTFKYDSYDSPNTSIQHTLSESVIYLKKLSELFGFEFLASVSAKWRFDDLDDKLATFLEKYNDVQSTKLEYEMIRNFLSKLAIGLSTSTERAFRESRTPLVNAQYRSVIARDVAVLNKLKSDTKWYYSWEKFMDAFYGSGAENFVYTYDGFPKLNEHLKIAYDNDYLMEIMVANMLKCYFPSISLNYFYVIRCVYIIARMIRVYTHLFPSKPEFAKKTLEDIMNDVNIICSVGVIIYENNNYIFKQTSHSLPRSANEVNEKTNMYILNHLFTGGQYYLLKMLERSAPALANMIYEVHHPNNY